MALFLIETLVFLESMMKFAKKGDILVLFYSAPKLLLA